jgi:hypothetical protein
MAVSSQVRSRVIADVAVRFIAASSPPTSSVGS